MKIYRKLALLLEEWTHFNDEGATRFRDARSKEIVELLDAAPVDDVVELVNLTSASTKDVLHLSIKWGANRQWYAVLVRPAFVKGFELDIISHDLFHSQLATVSDFLTNWLNQETK